MDKDGSVDPAAAELSAPDAAPLKLEEFLPYRLNVAAALASQALSRIYAERYGIGVPEWRVLVTLGQYGVMTGKAIGEHAHMHKTKVSRAVALLESRKLLLRRANKADMRESFLSLTPAGRAIYQDLAPVAAAFARRFIEAIDPADRAAFDRALKAIIERAQKLDNLARAGKSRGNAVKLYGYFRSSAAYRVRIALNLKKLPYDHQSVHLTRNGGWQWSEEFRAINPQKRVPALALSTGEVLLQSLAIIEYLDEVYPEPPLLPADAIGRAQVRAVAQIIACDIHPLNNLVALNYLKGPLKHDQAAADEWYRHWVAQGFDALEALLRPGPCAFGAHPTLADICLVPQVFNARRFKTDMAKYPKIAAVEAACLKLPAFDKARPENQPDAE